ncbi:hypothetical protein PS15m_006904 [Mucor circinelloides]
MKLINKRAVILIPQAIPGNMDAAHSESLASMQTTDSSYYVPEANIYIKKEPADEELLADTPSIDTQDNAPTESNMLSREQSASYFDVDGGNANDGEPPLSRNDLQLALKQEQDREDSDESANEGYSIVKQEGRKTTEQVFDDQPKRVVKQEMEEHDDFEDSSNEDEFIVKKEEQRISDKDITKPTAKQGDNNDEEGEDDTESIVKQEKEIANDDDEDAVSQEFMVKHEEEEVGKGEIVLHQKDPEHIPATDNQDNIYKCRKCHYRAADFMSLINHRQSAHNGKKYQGSSIKHLHLNPIIDDPQQYCRSCERKFATRHRYRNHLRIVHHIPSTEGSITSSMHPTTSNDSNAISEETSIHTTATEWNEEDTSAATTYRRGRRFKCRFCKEIFGSMLILTRHQISLHNRKTKGPRKYCKDCSTKFKSRIEFEQHRHLVHSANANKNTAAADADSTPDTDAAAPTANTLAAPTTSVPAATPQSGGTLRSRITCKRCGMVFGSIKDHLNHFNSVHRVYATKRPMLDPKQNEPARAKRRTRRKDKVKTVRFLLPDTHSFSKKKAHQIPSAVKYRCRRCDIEYDTRSDLTRHRWSVHDDLSRASSKEKSDQLPSTDQFRCRHCLADYESRSALVHHLSAAHKNSGYSSPKEKSIPLPRKKSIPLPRKKNIPSTTITTNFQCQKCLFVCDNRSALVVHIWATHRETMRKANKQPPVSSEQTVQELQVADVDQSHNVRANTSDLSDPSNNTSSYLSHMDNAHNVSFAKQAYKRPRENTTTPVDTPTSATNSLPDVHDSNFYCRVCDRTLRSKFSFNSHLRAVHSIDPDQTLHPAKKRNVLLDIDDPDNYCTLCDLKFKDQSTFNQHLRSRHRIKRKLNTTPLTSNAKSKQNVLPPSESQKFVCSVCKQRQPTLGHHRQHLRISHQMVLPPISHESPKFRYPDEFIDVNSPDLYCAQCDHYFSAEEFFKKHVEGVHKLSLV